MPNKILTRCVCCDNGNLISCLDLGHQPLANNLLSGAHSAESYVLSVNLCPHCWHLQQQLAVDPQLLFSNYLYVSGTSVTLRNYFLWFARRVKQKWPNAADVLDIACNDGSQLDSFASLGFDTFGVDPATNLHYSSNQKHQVICDFFDERAVDKLKPRQFDIIVAQNVLAHTANPFDFLLSAAKLMHNDSCLLVQTSQANMISNGEFDTVYHEHISFFSVCSMRKLVERAGLYLNHVESTPVHGTSWLFEIGKQSTPHSSVDQAIAVERQQSLYLTRTYLQWAQKSHERIEQIEQLCRQYQQQGYRLVGVGAAAKGITILNSLNCRLDCVLDENPLKQGKLIAGCLTPVVDFGELSKIDNSTPILFVCMAWNFMDELVSKIKKLRHNHQDKIFSYFPQINLVSL